MHRVLLAPGKNTKYFAAKTNNKPAIIAFAA